MNTVAIQRNEPFPKSLLTQTEQELYRRIKIVELGEVVAQRLSVSEADVFGALVHAAKSDGLLSDDIPAYTVHAETLAFVEARA